MEIQVGKYQVYSSGTIIGVLNEPLIFKIDDLAYEFIFKDEIENPNSRINIVPVNDKTARIEFINFNNSLGIGNTAPIQLGTIKRKDIFLNYRIYSLHQNAGKLVHYTWLLKNEERKIL